MNKYFLLALCIYNALVCADEVDMETIGVVGQARGSGRLHR